MGQIPSMIPSYEGRTHGVGEKSGTICTLHVQEGMQVMLDWDVAARDDAGKRVVRLLNTHTCIGYLEHGLEGIW